MPSFSYRSLKNLETCHPLLQKVLNEAIKFYDFTVIQGHRGEAEQNKAYKEGKSTKKFPESKHNQSPSLAADVVPYDKDGVPWKDDARFGIMLGHIQQCAMRLGIRVRLGADWDSDGKTTDEKLRDLPHVELVL